MAIKVTVSNVKGKKAVSSPITTFQQQLVDYTKKQLEERLQNLEVNLVFLFQMNKSAKVSISRPRDIANYTLNLPAFGTPEEEIDAFGYFYGSISSYEKLQNWNLSQVLKFDFVAEFNQKNADSIKEAEKNLVATLPEEVKPQGKTVIQTKDGKKLVTEAVAKKNIPHYTELVATIEAEIKVMRALGYNQNLTVTLQLQTKVSKLGGLQPDSLKNADLELYVLTRTMKGVEEQPLSLMKFVIRHQIGHWHHMLVNADSNKWSSRTREQWAMSYAYFRGSSAQFYSVAHKNVKIANIGLPKEFWVTPESTRPTDLPAEDIIW